DEHVAMISARASAHSGLSPTTTDAAPLRSVAQRSCATNGPGSRSSQGGLLLAGLLEPLELLLLLRGPGGGLLGVLLRVLAFAHGERVVDVALGCHEDARFFRRFLRI